MLNFDHLYEMQKNFTIDFFNNKHKICLDEILKDENLKIKWNKEYILSIIKEASELLDAFNWKMNTNEDKEIVRDNFLENSIDVFKYILGLMILNGFTEKEIYEKFIQKSLVVQAKLEQSLLLDKLEKNSKIAILDIDGVLAKYPDHFLEYANKKYDLYYKNDYDFRTNEKKLYSKAKYEYRISGEKLNISPIEYASEFTKLLKNNEYSIILVTARPYIKILRIYHDTLKWLQKNDIKYDAIIWEYKKSEYIIKHLNNYNIQLAIDDDIKNCNQLISLRKFKVYLMKNPKMQSNHVLEESIKLLDCQVKVIKSLYEVTV